MSWKQVCDIECPGCEKSFEVDLQDIVDDYQDEIMDLLEDEIEEEAERIAHKWTEEQKTEAHVWAFNELEILMDKKKYYPAPVDLLYEIEQIIRNAKEKMRRE